MIDLTSAAEVKQSGFKIPKDRYALRITDAEFKQSKKDNPMIEFDLEIVAPAVVDLPDGTKGEVAGRQLKFWLVLTEKNAGNILNFQKALGLDTASFDETNPDTNVYKEKIIDAIISCTESVSRKDPTPEQAKAGKLGDPILDNEGNQIKYYRPQIEKILGLSTAAVNAPY